MSRSPDAVAFAQARDQLNQKIATTPRSDIRVLLKHPDQKNLLEKLYRTSIFGLEKHDTSPFDFVDAVIGDGLPEARVKIFAAVLSLTTDPTAEIWTCFISALALGSPNDRHRDFRDECIPEFDLEYIESQLGKRFASIFEEKLCDFCPPDSDCKFKEKLGVLRKLVEGGRHYYETETWTHMYNQELGKIPKKRECKPERTGNCWPEQAALKIVEHNKELLREFYLEHIKSSLGYTEARPIVRRHTLQQACEKSDKFLSGVQTRVRILATLLSIKVPWEAHAWNVFIEACMSGSAGADGMLDEHLPYTLDDIDRIFKHKFDHAARNSFHNGQFWFCLLKIRRPSSERSESRIPVLLAHMPFLRKEKCGEGASNVAVFYVDIIPGHIQNINEETWNLEPVRLAMKQIPVDNNANQEVKVNMLIQTQAFKHNHIVEIRGIYRLDDAVLIFMEPADCNLYEFMTERCPDPACEPKLRKARLQMFTKISNALVHLHTWLEEDSKKIHFMHKDLKAENILVMLNHDDVERSILKLTDFGLSSIKAESSSQSSRGSQPIDRSSRTRLPTTAVHFAPEAWKNKTVTKKSDVWAFGTGLAEVVVWIAKGSQRLKDLERERCNAGTPNFFTLDNGVTALSPVVTAWFESLIDELGLSEDAWLMYKSCWLLLKHVCLVCDPERRGKMEDVQKFLQDICNGNKNVPDAILSEFPERANDETGHTDNTEDGLIRSPTTTTRSTQRSDSVLGATGAVSRTSTASGHRTSSTGSSTSSPPVADGSSQNASSKRTRGLIPWPFKKALNRKKDAAGFPLPRNAPFSDLRGTTSISDAIQRQQSLAGTSVGAAEQHPSRVTGQSAMNLQEAASRGDPDSLDRISQLLTTEQGRNDINTKDKSQMTPLLNALKLENVQAAILLIEEGADVNMVPNSAWSALHYAVRISGDNGGLPTILLQRSPGLIKKKDREGDTVLHRLAGSPSKGTLGRLKEMVKALEESDIGRSALDEALRSRNGKMKTPLESLPGDMFSKGERENIGNLLKPRDEGSERSRSNV